MTHINPPYGRWGFNPFGAFEDHEAGIREMCDTAAEKFAKTKSAFGPWQLVRFECMGCEEQSIRKYMSTKHPQVPYALRMLFPAQSSAMQERVIAEKECDPSAGSCESVTRVPNYLNTMENNL
jgi:hypothetical protein